MHAPPQFGDRVEPHHQRLSFDDDADVYVVGDVHGSREALDHLLDALALGPRDRVVFVGDLVRKGPDSPGVIDRVRTDDRLVSVRGNNEQKVVRGEKDPDWLRAGDRDYLASLPVAISFADALVVHGGVDPERPLADHGVEELLTMRAPHGDGYDGPFWYDDYDGPHRVFFGHTVHAEPVVRPHAVGLDTGCVYGGALTAYDYRTDRFVAVDPETTHEERSESKIVTPA
ncbi:serine/threonine protein phosphatase 1 [Halarchaeum rubridurum]|uniref:Serine/threonine protein phosphatase n=1 Tax=Halarchaeum rubridurum TaxID=489911 RepID=A0A830FXV0_9EURY|nr:metallophosphoesterase family protein [Halarchaeum rubridurum]MBP1953991.1 serine/threonine protein phosphatase 1 [Halarchaeum rubridurum]GGM56471.1 serine/threonine protein phosphatase [Halarchaeum rubridurum]